ncbi:MAG: DsbA family protein [Piscinibacter sp.]|uniref:DsbA family protein n=1 Tax=Piscinibacter TaxID=1114981 RepID=UPI000FDD6E64|nr:MULTISPECIES: DsbA family protein [Piscinibacter]MCW5667470.1 DsbA family protein [Piscinibacter sp.]
MSSLPVAQPAGAPPRLVFHFGLRSPYSWLAERLLERFVAPHDRPRIEVVPYWDPRPDTLAALQARRATVLYRAMSRERHLYILGDVKAAARRLGLPLRWPVDGPQPDWELPHRACLAAGPDAAGDTLRRSLFAARFEQGRDIWQADTVQAVLRDCGVPAAEAPVDAEPAVDALERGYRNGVFGVPFFVVGRERFWGVDRLPFALRAAGLPWRPLAEAWLGEGAR